MIDIEIDGKKLEVSPGSMIIEAADAAGIPIPRFCYHKKLSIAANCRMCLVEVEKVGKPLPACATPVTAGMKVYTRSPKALDAQRSVMEFLLINHPLDCPICDQGGECELQDISVGYGPDISRFTEGKRSVEDEDIGSLIATDMTRCIHCTRCVRFGQEVAGIRELGATGRGEHMRIGTYVKHSMTSEVSGNIIDLCPVGALTSKPFRFKARAWELNQYPAIAPHDCLGSNVYIHARRQEVMRVVPKEEESINETWISDRDRFSYLGLRHPDRLQRPMIKQDGQWCEVDWQQALVYCAERLKTVKEQHGAAQMAGLISPSATLEEQYLLQKLLRGLDCQNIDHRLREADFTDQALVSAFPSLNIEIQALEKQNTILLIGTQIQREQPIAGLRVRKAALAGAKIFSVAQQSFDFNFPVTEQIVASPTEWITVLAGIAKALLENADKSLVNKEIKDLLANVSITEQQRNLASQLKLGEQSVVLLGQAILQHPQASSIRTLVYWISRLSKSTWGSFTEAANNAGAWLAGAVPHRGPGGMAVLETGLTAQQIWQQSLKAYVLVNFEPDLDVLEPQRSLPALAKADFVLALTSYRSAALLEHAHVLLPISPFTETSGTFVNCAGRWQSFAGSVLPFGETRPGWKVLRVLGNLLDLSGFDYASSEDVCEELRHTIKSVMPMEYTPYYPPALDKVTTSLCRSGTWAIYMGDSIVRRSEALQESAAADQVCLMLNSQLAAKHRLQADQLAVVKQGEIRCILPVVIDDRIADGCVVIPAGFRETAPISAAFPEIQIEVH